MTSRNCNIDENEKSHKLTFGFCHEIEKNNLLIIPEEIIQLCLLYFLQFFDEFIKDKHGKGISLSMNEDNRLTKLQLKSVRGYASAYGTFIMDFKELSNCIVEWTINIIQYTFLEVSVGIIEIDNATNHHVFLNNYPFDSKKSQNYGLYVSSSSGVIDLDSSGDYFYHYNLDNLVAGALKSIKMSVDINVITLTYFLNDKDYGLVFKDVDNLKKYQLIVAIRDFLGCSTKLEISTFDIIYKQ